MKIVLLERDASVRTHLKRFLSILIPDAEVREFTDVSLCMMSIAKHPPHLLIAAGEADDWHLFREFPRPARRFHAIALVDGRSDRAWRSALAAGADEVVTLPADDLVLKSKIETLLSGLYTSAYSFFGSADRGARLAPITLELEASVFEMNESRMEFFSSAFLMAGASVRVRWSGLQLAATVERCRPNLNRPGTYFVGARLEIATEQDAMALRRQLILAA
jgi:DNA-binding response OmpR family regulator